MVEPRPEARAAAPRTPDTRRVHRRHPLASALLIALAFGVIGVGPTILSSAALTALGVRLPKLRGPVPILARWPPATPTATSAADLALPRAAWIAAQTSVYAAPGGKQIAVLEPGFPVQLLSR